MKSRMILVLVPLLALAGCRAMQNVDPPNADAMANFGAQVGEAVLGPEGRTVGISAAGLLGALWVWRKAKAAKPSTPS